MHQSTTKQLGYATVGFILALALTAGFTSLAHADTATTTTNHYVFDADLSGANQVPPVSATTSTSTTNAATTTGHARVWFDMTNASGSATTTTTMWQWLGVWNGDDLTAAHLHCGLAGANGPVVLDLFHPAASSTDVNGTLVATSTVSTGNLHATTTGCSMPIANLTDLGNALKAGIIYANVHSLMYPNGVVRGQMALTSQSSTTTNPGMCMNQNNMNGWYDANNVWHSCATNGGNGGHSCNSSATSTNGWSGWYDANGIWHSCNGNGGSGGNSCGNMATSTNANGWSGWYDNTGTWHSCAGGNGNGGNNCVGAASTSLGWYDASGNWHACSGGNNGNGNCAATSTTGWYDSNGNWHTCNGNGGNGTSTPGFPGFPGGIGGGIGSSINGLLGQIFGHLQHILDTFLPTGTDTPALRSIRTLR